MVPAGADCERGVRRDRDRRPRLAEHEQFLVGILPGGGQRAFGLSPGGQVERDGGLVRNPDVYEGLVPGTAGIYLHVTFNIVELQAEAPADGNRDSVGVPALQRRRRNRPEVDSARQA